MGGRGSGASLPSGSGENINIQETTDVWSYRHKQGNEPFVDAINTSVGRIQNDFPDIMQTVDHVDAAKLGGKDAQQVLGYWDHGGKTLALNRNYTNIPKMNSVYDASVDSKYHPSRGNRTGTEAVTYHEMGHAVNEHIAQKMGTDFDTAAKTIVDRAYKNSGGTKGTKAWAGGISKYAQKNNAECIAEAMADWYCNGNKATKQSKAIMKELKRANK